MSAAIADLVIANTTVLCADAGRSIHSGVDVVVTAGHITALGVGAARSFQAKRVINGQNHLVTPGFCNAHTHSPEVLSRARADRAGLAEWLATVWSHIDALDRPTLEHAIAVAAAEMVRGGVTAVIDHFRQLPLDPERLDWAAQAWQATGLRVVLAVMVRDGAYPPWINGAVPTGHEQLVMIEAFAEKWNQPNSRVQVGIGPSAPTRCSNDLLAAAGDLSRRRNLKLHIHCDETRHEVALAQEQFGRSAISHLKALGCLGPHVSLAHVVWSTAADRVILAESGTAIVHNPVSNQRLGSGRMPIETFIEAGIPVMVGTDGAASNDTQNYLEALKLAVLLPRTAHDNVARWPTASDAWDWAVRDPARALGLNAAELAVGAPADLAIFDRGDPVFSGTDDWYSQVVYAGGTLRANQVIVAGEVVYG